MPYLLHIRDSILLGKGKSIIEGYLWQYGLPFVRTWILWSDGLTVSWAQVLMVSWNYGFMVSPRHTARQLTHSGSHYANKSMNAKEWCVSLRAISDQTHPSMHSSTSTPPPPPPPPPPTQHSFIRDYVSKGLAKSTTPSCLQCGPAGPFAIPGL